MCGQHSIARGQLIILHKLLIKIRDKSISAIFSIRKITESKRKNKNKKKKEKKNKQKKKTF